MRNSKWLKHLKLEDILNLTSRFTVARMLERDDFKKRFSTNIPIVIMEFLYPLMQAYDSVAIEADIELGGTDQRFNLLVGRELQKEFGQKPQIAITMPILVGIDGLEKMSKSLGNYIGVTEPPEEIFGKVMSIPDSIIIDYYRLLTRLAKSQIDEIERDMTHKGQNHVYVKRRLARLIVESLHNAEKATCAEKHFDSIFKEKKTPEQVQEYKLDNSDIKAGKVWLVGLLVKCKLAASNGEARRLISQGAIKIGGNKVDDVNSEIDVNYVDGKVIQKGKRHFRRISIN